MSAQRTVCSQDPAELPAPALCKAATGAQLSCQSQHQERAAKVGRNHLVKNFNVAFGYGKQRHDARVVHHHVDPAIPVQRLFEEAFHVCRVARSRLDLLLNADDTTILGFVKNAGKRHRSQTCVRTRRATETRWMKQSETASILTRT